MILKEEGYTYKFDAIRCASCEGNCCIGESGYIWITKEEIVALANFLDKSIDDVILDDIKKVGYKYSIKEIKIDQNNFSCKFFDLTKKQCSIYEVRPKQCRTFPFWDYFKDKIEEVKQECPAIIE